MNNEASDCCSTMNIVTYRAASEAMYLNIMSSWINMWLKGCARANRSHSPLDIFDACLIVELA